MNDDLYKKISLSFNHTFVGNTVLSDDDLKEIYEKTGLLLRNVNYTNTPISYSDYELIFVAIVNIIKNWDVENEEALFHYIYKSLLGVEDKTSFEKLGITFEEKAFYDILVKVRDIHQFQYEDKKCLVLAKKIKELVDEKSKYADWSTRSDIRNELNVDLTVLLYKNGYPPEWDEEVFNKILEQAENFKKYNG